MRCPWHGYDYSPRDGKPPPGFSDAPACFPCEVRDDGVYVGAAQEQITETGQVLLTFVDGKLTQHTVLSSGNLRTF